MESFLYHLLQVEPSESGGGQPAIQLHTTYLFVCRVVMDRETEFGGKVGCPVESRFRMSTAPIFFGIEPHQRLLIVCGRCRQGEILARTVEGLSQWLDGRFSFLMDEAASFCQNILVGVCQEQSEHSFADSLQVDDSALLGADVQCFQTDVLMETIKVQTIGR